MIVRYAEHTAKFKQFRMPLANGCIFIPGNVPSSKNSKQFVHAKGGRPFLVDSKVTREYKKATEWYWAMHKKDFLKMVGDKSFPLRVKFRFVRGSRRKFDYVNPLQTVQDIMQKYGWIPDDDSDHLFPLLEGYSYDKQQPGVYISLE